MKSTGKRTTTSRSKKAAGGSKNTKSSKGSSPKSGSSRFREDGPREERSYRAKPERSYGEERPKSARPSRPSRAGSEASSARPERGSSRSGGYKSDRTDDTKRPYTRAGGDSRKSSARPTSSEGKRSYTRGGSEKSERGSFPPNREGGFKKSYTRGASSERPERGERSERSVGSRSLKTGGSRLSNTSRTNRDERPKRSYSDERPSFDGGERKPYKRRDSDTSEGYKPRTSRSNDQGDARPKGGRKSSETRLNKFLSNAGIASRREADKLIELGLVSVNGKVVTELGHKVDAVKDVVRYDSVVLKPEPMRYVLLNKPKDYMTTLEETDKRRSVMALIDNACHERIYPVGRLDRQTTGLLLFTNDGEIAKRLTNPRNGIPKLYHVETIEKIKGEHLDAFRNGVELEGGFAKAEDAAFVNDDARQVGMRIHSGRSRIVRGLLEHFGYTIKKLDRVMYAGLTKKDLARGRYRHLSEQEVNFLRMIR
jgi:23S rRNA pseudouridine2605 synthase